MERNQWVSKAILSPPILMTVLSDPSVTEEVADLQVDQLHPRLRWTV